MSHLMCGDAPNFMWAYLAMPTGYANCCRCQLCHTLGGIYLTVSVTMLMKNDNTWMGRIANIGSKTSVKNWDRDRLTWKRVRADVRADVMSRTHGQDSSNGEQWKKVTTE